MKKLFLFMVLPGFILAKSLILSPNKDLSLEDLAFVAQGGKVELSPLALSNIEAGFKVLLDAVLEGKNIYGLSVGVGWNKDRAVFNIKNGQKTIDEDLIKLSKQFNKISLRAHALGLGEPLDPKIVRMAMLQRLYTATKGQAGISPDLAKRYVEFLNLNITPVVPSFGSVGEADITLAAHIGLAMMGEYKVWYKGKIMNSGEVLKLAKLKPLEPVAKDFLSILSNNTLMNAYLVLELEKLEKNSFLAR
ncbi:aromatic amino acid lyase [Campylobacter coli]